MGAGLGPTIVGWRRAALALVLLLGVYACDGPIVGPGLEPPDEQRSLSPAAQNASSFGNGGATPVSAPSPTSPAQPTAPTAPATTTGSDPGPLGSIFGGMGMNGAAPDGPSAGAAAPMAPAPMGPATGTPPPTAMTPPGAASPPLTPVNVCASAAAQPMGVELAFLPVLSAPSSGVVDTWTPLRTALTDFFAEQESAGMAVSILGASPPAVGQNCPADVRVLAEATTLPAAGFGLDVGLLFATGVEGGIETVKAAVEYAVQRQAQMPELSTNLVILTDAAPTACEGSAEELAAATGFGQRGTTPVRSYVLAFGDYAMAYDEVAAAGGTDFARQVALDPGALLDELRTIRRQTRTCTFKLPEMSGGFDASLMRLRLRDASGSTHLVGAVAERSACQGGEGFYFDRPDNPTRLHACPTVCEQLGEGATLETETLCDGTLQQ